VADGTLVKAVLSALPPDGAFGGNARLKETTTGISPDLYKELTDAMRTPIGHPTTRKPVALPRRDSRAVGGPSGQRSLPRRYYNLTGAVLIAPRPCRWPPAPVVGPKSDRA
jgi:hypothetical protein